MKYFFIPLTTALLFCASYISAETPNNFSTTSQTQQGSQRIQEIDQEINQLKIELNQYLKKEMQDIAEGQKYMIADWDKYSIEIQEARQNELKAQEIRAKISLLEQEKKHITSSNKK